MRAQLRFNSRLSKFNVVSLSTRTYLYEIVLFFFLHHTSTVKLREEDATVDRAGGIRSITTS